MVQTALRIHVQVQQTALLKSQLAINHTEYLKEGSYLDILGGTAVNVTTRAANSECASRDVAEGDEAAATILGANNLLITFANLDLIGLGSGEDSSGEGESNKNELHVDEMVIENVFLSKT